MIAPHPKQGWHVKVTVDVEGAPGGAKQKVFGISCPGAGGVAPVGQPTLGGTTVATTDVPTTEVPATGGAGTSRKVAGQPIAGGVEDTAATGAVPPTFGNSSVDLFDQRESAAGGGAPTTRVKAQAATGPSALPFTGAGIATLLTIGPRCRRSGRPRRVPPTRRDAAL